MISKGNLMAKLQVYRGVSFTGCKAMLRQLCDKAMHRITLTIATSGASSSLLCVSISVSPCAVGNYLIWSFIQNARNW